MREAFKSGVIAIEKHSTVESMATQAQAGFRADRALCALLGDLNRRAAKALFKHKLVRINGTIASGAERVRAGDRFEHPDPSAHPSVNLLEKAKAPRLTTPHGRHLVRLYEDDDVLVINKPAEIPVHRGQGGFTRRDTLEDVLEIAYPKGFFFVHRLDMETSGCLLIAKNAAVRDALIKDFSERKVRKSYLAIVEGGVAWDEMVCTRPIKYLKGDEKKKAGAVRERKAFYSHLRQQKFQTRGAALRPGQKKGVALAEGSTDGKACETHFKTLERFRGMSLVRAAPKTGRTHQIRVHLATLGHGLCYDPLYGRASAWRMREFDPSTQNTDHGEEIVLNRLPLHAWKLGFVHPVSKEKMLIEAPIPGDLKKFVRVLRKFRR